MILSPNLRANRENNYQLENGKKSDKANVLNKTETAHKEKANLIAIFNNNMH